MAVEAGNSLQRGREAYGRRAWEEAARSLESADRDVRLGLSDLELLGTAYYMLGDDRHLEVLERAHRECVEAGEGLLGARVAFFIGINLALRGELSRASGWFGRAQRLVDREGRECVEQGYLLLPIALRSEAQRDPAGAYETAAAAAAIAERFRDADLFALATHTQGRALIRQGRVAAGLALLDEAMLAVSAGELSPVITGVVYCGVIAACDEAFELRRAREWTDALSRWCEEQPQLVAFNGRCRVHRAEIMQFHGAWAEALEEAVQARERSARAANPAAVGEATYQQGEIHRRRGDLAAAEDAYREANRCGREPQPGLALLRLAQGDGETAYASIRRALAEQTEPPLRARLLPAAAEIALALGRTADARADADELERIGLAHVSPLLEAYVLHVRGTVELAEGVPEAALASLRGACRLWQELDAPYDTGRTRVQLALASRAVGDEDAAGLELEAARTTFEQLGATGELARVASLEGRGPVAHGLTGRELQVLSLVSAGRSNREIASELVVSEHTVARHLQNIFRKLGVSSRTAATAFAFEHGLV
jgi:DNA-binding CsgD family transcriptional regulator